MSSRINPKRIEKQDETAHLNFMGGINFEVGPILKLKLATGSCFFGEPQYYLEEGTAKTKIAATGNNSVLSLEAVKRLRETLDAIDPIEWRSMTPKKLIESVIDKALDFSAEETLSYAAELRNVGLIRVTPIIILVRAANHPKVKNTGLVRKYAKEILRRADEPATAIAYQLSEFGKPIPNSLKRALADYLATVSEYSLAKYREENKKVSTLDVVKLVTAKSPAIQKLYNGKLKQTGATWEAIVSEKGSNKQSWDQAFEKMPHMALLRNLRNLIDKSSVPAEKIEEKLLAGVEEGKQFPFRYLSAAKEISHLGLKAALSKAAGMSINNLPKLSGKTAILADNSGSTRGTPISELSKMTVAEIGNLNGLILSRMSETSDLFVFGDRLIQINDTKTPINRLDLLSAEKLMKEAGNEAGGGTENGIWLFFDNAIRENISYDRVAIFSDMQAGHGELYGEDNKIAKEFLFEFKKTRIPYIDVAKLIRVYHQKVNPNTKFYCIQIAGYPDTLVPEYYKNVFFLSGWSPALFSFISYIENITQ